MAELLEAGVVQDLRQAELTYSEVGATSGTLPPGYHHQRLSAPVGYGRAQFEAAADCLLRWKMHAHAGLHPQVSDEVVQEGSVAVLRLHLGPIRLRVPVRVIRVVDQPFRRGFVYGTLPGHPERGEESFVVEMADDGTVFFHLLAFSRPGRWFTLLGRPVSRAGQVLVSERYLSAVREAAQSVSDAEVA
jgi:uncharacterized protein (UPF0548 family)